MAPGTENVFAGGRQKVKPVSCRSSPVQKPFSNVLGPKISPATHKHRKLKQQVRKKNAKTWWGGNIAKKEYITPDGGMTSSPVSPVPGGGGGN